MRSVGPVAVSVVVLAGGLLLAGCTTETGDEGAGSLQSSLPPTTQSRGTEPEPETTESWTHPDIPFDLRSPADPWVETQVLHASDAAPEGSGSPTSLLTVTATGQTTPGEGGLPGPSVRTILSSTEALAGQLQPELGVEITDLSQVPTILGTLNQEGVFTSDSTLARGVSELPGSNPDGLYFEPQDFSSAGEWVAWREGSAGQKDALPTLDFDDWRIVAWDQTQNQPQEYASGYLLHGQRQAPRIAWAGPPTVDGRYIYYAAALPASLVSGDEGEQLGEEWPTSVIRVPLDQPGAVEVVGLGSAPAASPDGGVYWVQDGTALVYSTQAEPDSPSPVFEVSTPGWSIASLTAEGGRVFATVVSETSENAWILAWDMSAHLVSAAVESGADWVQLSVGGDLVAWGNGTANSDPSMYLWRAGDEGIVLLGATQGLSLPQVGGGLLAVPAITDEGAVTWELALVH